MPPVIWQDSPADEGGFLIPMGMYGECYHAFVLAGIRQGAQLGLQISLSVPRELGAVLIALVILFVAISDVYRPALERLLTRKERKNRRKSGKWSPGC